MLNKINYQKIWKNYVKLNSQHETELKGCFTGKILAFADKFSIQECNAIYDEVQRLRIIHAIYPKTY